MTEPKNWNKERAYALALYIFSHKYLHRGMTNTYHPNAFDTYRYFHPVNDNGDTVAEISVELIPGLGKEEFQLMRHEYYEIITPIYNLLDRRWGNHRLVYRLGSNEDEAFEVGFYNDRTLEWVDARRQDIMDRIVRDVYRPEDDDEEEFDHDGPACCTPSRTQIKPKRSR